MSSVYENMKRSEQRLTELYQEWFSAEGKALSDEFSSKVQIDGDTFTLDIPGVYSAIFNRTAGNGKHELSSALGLWSSDNEITNDDAKAYVVDRALGAVYGQWLTHKLMPASDPS